MMRHTNYSAMQNPEMTQSCGWSRSFADKNSITEHTGSREGWNG